MTRGSAIFCIVAGSAIPVLWSTLIATGQVTDIAVRMVAYGFHWTAEGLTAVFLVLSGVAVLRRMSAARRLFFVAAGLLSAASLGMFVYYGLLGDVLFAATGMVTAGLILFFVVRSRIRLSDAVYAVTGAVLYALLTGGGNALQSGNTLAAVYLLIGLAFAALFLTAALVRGL